MPASPHATRLRALLASAPIFLLAAAPLAAAATSEPVAEHRADPRERPLPGAYCTSTSCRDPAASPWMAAAFGAAVLVIHRSARSRPLR